MSNIIQADINFKPDKDVVGEPERGICECCDKEVDGAWDDQSFSHEFGTRFIYVWLTSCCQAEFLERADD